MQFAPSSHFAAGWKLNSRRVAAFVFVCALFAPFALLAGNGAAYGGQPAVPTLEDGAGWQLQDGCRVRKFGILTAADCDVLSGDGIAVQITRIRLLELQAGQDDRSTIGVELRPMQGSWSFSSPYVDLMVGRDRFAPSDVDEAIAFPLRGGSSAQRLQPHQDRYLLPLGERRFFRLRFAVSQDALRSGFTLQITGLQKDGVAVRVPVIGFDFPSKRLAWP